MAIQSIFLEAERPALDSAAEFLLSRFATKIAADLRNVTVVLPTGRSGRRLLEILVDRCDAEGRMLNPPRISNVGQFPELLYPAQRPFADELTQQLTWAAVLRDFDRTDLRNVIAQPPSDHESRRWLELGNMLRTLHRELASDALDFADVIERGTRLADFPDADRWRTLAEIQRRFLARLDALGLWDRQTARRVAIQRRECRLEHPLILIGTVDLNQAMRQMLDMVADHVTALVCAPSSWRNRFDEHGCLVPEAWESVELNIADEQLIDADDAADQAESVVRRIASFNGRFRAEAITIGVPDEQIIPQIMRLLDECEIPNRYGPGRHASATSVYRLLEDLAELLEGGRYVQFAALVRHPDMESWLLREKIRPGWIEQLDDYYNEHLPTRVDANWLCRTDEFASLKEAYQRIAQLIGGLDDKPRPLADWLPQIGRLVSTVYGDRSFDLNEAADRTMWHTIQETQKQLGNLATIPASLMPECSAAETIQMLLDQMASALISPAATEPAIELVGWLELPLDDAPALLVTSFNEGFVPSSANADAFLPNSLRTELGLNDNARRYARDAYAVSTLLAPWRDTTFIVARRNEHDDPLAPSRLLFAAPRDVVARRALRFFSPPASRPARSPLAGALTSTRTDFAFDVPRPTPLSEPIERLRVTSFAAYLACPYRFYLGHVLRHRAVNDDATELDGASFGNLAHDVLEQFGHSEERDARDADVIWRCFEHHLNLRVRLRYGKHPGAAVRIQVEQLRARLRALAAWQAERAAAGWRIEYAELSFSESPAELIVDGRAMLLTGRIDRIDVNDRTGERQILDYKTSDRGDKPDKTHRQRGKWVDLQLPLYRHLARSLGIDQYVSLGYVLLPRRVADVGLSMAEWTDAELADADQLAFDVVRRIRREEFWPPTSPPPTYSEEFAYLCMDGVFGKRPF